MSMTINAKLFGKLEARLEDLHDEFSDENFEGIGHVLERLDKVLAEIRGTSTTGAAAVSESESAKGKKGRKAKTADGEPKAKREVKPGSWADQVKNVYTPLFNEVWTMMKEEDAEKYAKKPQGLHMKIAGYLKTKVADIPTKDDMREAIVFLLENPDHQSETQKTRSVTGSTDEKPKARGRPKKVKADEEKPKPAEVIAKLEAALSEADDDSDSDDDEEEDDESNTPLVAFEYKGNNYLKDPFQEVYTSEGKMEWVGTFNGKKIVKGDMPARVKKLIESQD